MNDLFRRYLAQSSTFENFIINVDKAEGVYVWDRQGKRYFDFISSICVNNAGHRNPAVMAALQAQMEKYLHVMVYGEFIQQPQIDYAQRLCSLLPPELQKIFFVNCGAEAIEGAIKLARLYNRRSEIVSFRGSYHGSTMGAMSALGNTEIHDRFSPLLPSTALYDHGSFECMEKITEKTCCVIIEPIQAGTGMTVPPDGFLQALRERCTSVGALLIYDEIQTGFGRTGKLFAFEHCCTAPAAADTASRSKCILTAIPDILCIAKGMGGGMPLGGFVASEKLMSLLDVPHPLMGHASTFGGHPLSCVSALASLNIIVDLLPTLAEKEAQIRSALKDIPHVKEVRGKGLFLCAQTDFNEAEMNTLVGRCMAEGFISFYPLFNHHAMCLTPPLTITLKEIDEAMLLFKKAVQG
jgi:acetylornithine/succinyldiaminopimelate/putrescine aminotransferase